MIYVIKGGNWRLVKYVRFILPHVLFKDNKVYRYCFINREFAYSNGAFDQKLNRVFENINNVFIISLGNFHLRNYDLFDGHFSKEANKYVMKKLSEYIREFDD